MNRNEKISNSLKGNKNASGKQKKRSEETKEKIRQARLGKHHSDETKKKISDSVKERIRERLDKDG